jgi:hypothetical protein
MRKLAMLVVMVGMMGVVGCGSGVFFDEPEINDQAKTALPGTWSDSEGEISISFAADGQITGISGSALPLELAGVTFDGSSFSFTVPEIGMELGAQLVPEVVTVGPDGSVDIQYRGELTGALALLNPGYIQITVTGQLDDVNDPSTLTGSLSATAYLSDMLQSLLGLDEEMDLMSDFNFVVGKE